MSDQMPDEVWVADDWLAHYDEPWEGGTHYVRADLYDSQVERAERSEIALVETSRDSGLFVNFDYQGIDPADLGQHFTDAMQALTTRNAVSKAACAQLIAEQAQRAEQAEAERDRLRAALEEIRDWPEDWRRDGWAVAQEFQGIAQEALDHD